MAVDGRYIITANTPIGTHSGTIALNTAEGGVQVIFSLMGNDINVMGSGGGDTFAFSCNFTADYENVWLEFEGTADGETLEARASTAYGRVLMEGKKA